MVGASRNAEGATGIIRVGESVALVAAHAVKPTSDEGDPAGTLVYGARLAGKLLSDLQSTTGVAVTPLPAGARPPISGLHAVPILPPGDTLEKFSVRLEDNWNDPAGPTAWLEGVGLDGQPILFKLHFAPARFADVARRPLIIIALVAGAGVLLLAIVLSLVEFSVLRAVASLDRQMAAFAQNPTAGGTITIGGSQEFSRLAASANEMLEAFRDQSEELDSERELLRSVLDAAAEGLLAFCAKRDSDGRIVDFMLARANPAGLRLLPVPESEVPGWSLREALEGVGGDEPLWRSFVQVAETGVPEHVITPSRLNPENRWLDRQLSPWGDGVVLSVSDVTEQRESEQQLRASLAEIERFNRAMLDREERVLELKREINDLATTRGEAIRYHSVT